ncbi:hypothetical protein LK12_09775 [Novosphingobium malaysiense]|uniref:HTH luxR-type domain-containing protein n=2 Tax=Novosphingobium malaysiense TaxID=1348853 RepID=A0A0B1ZPI2_9SPHN|nr:hypothetical protein LK12_09775 [Novosphingobium malaysiense]
MGTSVTIVILQSLAAVYFVIDGIDDVLAQFQNGITLEAVMECLVAFALLAGVVTGARHIGELREHNRRSSDALARAKGALSEVIAARFAQWKLSSAEADVALFALKGCNVQEIARLRGSAAGTVRAQLSQVYAKSGVSSQAMLVSQFIEDLL